MPRKPAPALSPQEKAELSRQGAKAAARGDSRATNPMRQPVNSPEATGESANSWEQRRDAWHSGHDHQSQQAPAPAPAATDKDNGP